MGRLRIGTRSVSRSKDQHRSRSVSHSKGTLVAEQARKLFDQVKIRDVALVECRARLGKKVTTPMEVGIGRSASAAQSEDGSQVIARITFSLQGRPEGDQTTEAQLLIEATFEAAYDVPKDVAVEREALDLFAHANGIFNLWPYWREFVQSVSTRMGLNGLVVPTYRIEEAFTGPGTSDRTHSQARDPSATAGIPDRT